MKKSSGTLGEPVARRRCLITRDARADAPALSRRGRHPADAVDRPRPAAGLRALLRPRRRSRRVQRRVPHSQLPAEPVRRRRAVGVVHSRSTRRSSRAASGATPTAWPARSASLLALVGQRHRPRRRARHAAAHRRRSRPGSTGEQRELTIRARPHPVSRRRPARAVRVVPRRAEQPPPLPALVHRAGDVERRDDRDAGRLRRPDAAASPGGDAGAGDRSSAARCSSSSSCRRCCASRRHCGCRFDRRVASTCATVVRNFVPVFFSRGVVQISAYVDTLLASLLPTGAVAGLTNAQLLYTLPVSLFGMSVSAAELPAHVGGARRPPASIRRPPTRCGAGSRPGCARSRSSSSRRPWRFLRSATSSPRRCFRPAGSATRTRSMSGAFSRARRSGCFASTLGRLYSSTYYALRDTRTPLRYADRPRRCSTTVLGYLFAIPLPRWLGIARVWGAAGLTLVGRAGGLGRDAAAAAHAQRTNWPDRLAGRVLAKLWGAGHRRRRGRVDGEAALPTLAPRDRRGCRARARTASTFLWPRSCFAFAEASAALERVTRLRRRGRES